MTTSDVTPSKMLLVAPGRTMLFAVAYAICSGGLVVVSVVLLPIGRIAVIAAVGAVLIAAGTALPRILRLAAEARRRAPTVGGWQLSNFAPALVNLVVMSILAGHLATVTKVLTLTSIVLLSAVVLGKFRTWFATAVVSYVPPRTALLAVALKSLVGVDAHSVFGWLWLLGGLLHALLLTLQLGVAIVAWLAVEVVGAGLGALLGAPFFWARRRFGVRQVDSSCGVATLLAWSIIGLTPGMVFGAAGSLLHRLA